MARAASNVSRAGLGLAEALPQPGTQPEELAPHVVVTDQRLGQSRQPLGLLHFCAISGELQAAAA